jgi:hypothetical protein
VALASLLRGYGIRSGSIRVEGGETPKGYYLRSFQEAFDRYLPPIGAASPASSRHAATTPGKPEESENFASATGAFCGGSENAGNPSNSAACGGVAARRPGEGEIGECGGGSADPDAEDDIIWRAIGERA